MSDSADELNLLDLPLGSFLELVSDARPAPAGGSAAAIAVGLAAGLCVKAALLSIRQMPDASDAVAIGHRLSDRAASLCQADADAYGLVIAAMRRPGEPDPQRRRLAVAEALSSACDVPVEIVEIAADVVSLAVRIAENVNPNLIGDVVTAALLAEAGARSATALVQINLVGEHGDGRPSMVAALLKKIAEDSARVWRARFRD